MKKLLLAILIVVLFSTYSFAKTIVIDIGHTLEKPGVMSARGNPEILFNFLTGVALGKKLVNLNYDVYLLVNLPLSKRVEEINKMKPDLVISIHHDSVQQRYLSKWTYKGKEYLYSDKFSGYSIFVSKKNGEFRKSLKFANLVGEFLTKDGMYPTYHHAEPIPGENRELLNKEFGVYRYDDLIILKTNVPSILLECGIIVNRSDELALRSDYIINLISDSVIKAVSAYFNNHSL